MHENQNSLKLQHRTTADILQRPGEDACFEATVVPTVFHFNVIRYFGEQLNRFQSSDLDCYAPNDRLALMISMKDHQRRHLQKSRAQTQKMMPDVGLAAGVPESHS